MSVGKTIRKLREKKGMSIHDLAIACELTDNAVWKIEMGKISNPAMTSIINIAKALGVSTDDLLTSTKRMMDNAR